MAGIEIHDEKETLKLFDGIGPDTNFGRKGEVTEKEKNKKKLYLLYDEIKNYR